MREKILAQIRHSLHRDELSDNEIKQLQKRMQESPRGILPKLPHDLVTLFVEKATRASAHVERFSSLLDVQNYVVNFLKNNKHSHLKIAADSILKKFTWPQINILTGPANPHDAISLTTCLCGVAETGTLVFISSPESPTTLNFLPEIHFVLLSEKNIVAHYEDAWDFIKARDLSPRTVNFITGPSRTGDIEQTIQMGIHGPKQLFILLYNEE